MIREFGFEVPGLFAHAPIGAVSAAFLFFLVAGEVDGQLIMVAVLDGRLVRQTGVISQ